EQDLDSEDLLMNEDFDILDDNVDEEEQEERSARSRSFNMDMRHRIEDRLEERRLKKELNEYESFDLDDDLLH
ncbi:PA3496 family putative envelope integrity protein, partial [uncultured Alcanivorax sp.]